MLQRTRRTVGLVLIGSMLSTMLPGCAPRERIRLVPTPAPPPIVKVVTVKDVPPAELLACPVRPEGFPTDTQSAMPEAVRAAIIRLARAFAANSAQLDRLIDWTKPGSCKP